MGRTSDSGARRTTIFTVGDSAVDVKRVVLVDDDVAFAEALGLAMSLTPHLDVVGRAHDADSGFDTVMGTNPDLLICDYRLRDSVTGIQCARRLRQAGFTAPVVILTSYLVPRVHREVDSIPRAFALSKQESITTLITDFGSVAAGTYRPRLDPTDELLSEGEYEVLELVNAGKPAAEIATELHISVHTVRSRLKSLMRKLEVSSQVEAVAAATRLGLLVPPS